MPFSMSQASLPVFEIGLNALSGVLDKAAALAAAKKVDPAVLLGWRLAPDMFALAPSGAGRLRSGQERPARLAGVEPPKIEDNETRFDQLKERIAKTWPSSRRSMPRRSTAQPIARSPFRSGRAKGRMKRHQYSTTSCCRISTSI